MRALAVRYRASLIALLFIVVGFLLLTWATSWIGHPSYATALDRLTADGMDGSDATALLDDIKGSSAIGTVLTSLGGTLVGIGLVSMAWDLWVNRNWMKSIRDAVLHTVSGDVQVDPRQARETLLKRTLTSMHGPALGAALFAQSREISSREVRSDFIYDVELTGRDGGYISAEFRLVFKLPYLPEHPRVTFACVSNSLDFHNRYQQLVSNNPETLYRYVLVVDDDPRIGVPPFSVVDFSVTSRRGAMRFDQRQSTSSQGGHERHVDFDIQRASKRLWKQARNEPCEVELHIQTVIDGSRNDFPICFGYPVDGFRSRLDASAISANSVDVLEFFTSSMPFRREDSQRGHPAHSRGWASGRLDGLILPDSGLTYVWQ